MNVAKEQEKIDIVESTGRYKQYYENEDEKEKDCGTNYVPANGGNALPREWI